MSLDYISIPVVVAKLFQSLSTEFNIICARESCFGVKM